MFSPQKQAETKNIDFNIFRDPTPEKKEIKTKEIAFKAYSPDVSPDKGKATIKIDMKLFDSPPKEEAK